MLTIVERTVRDAALLPESLGGLGPTSRETVTSSDEVRVRGTCLESARSLEMSRVCDLALALELLAGWGRLSRVGVGDVCQSGSGYKSRDRAEVDHDHADLSTLERLVDAVDAAVPKDVDHKLRRREPVAFYLQNLGRLDGKQGKAKLPPLRLLSPSRPPTRRTQ